MKARLATAPLYSVGLMFLMGTDCGDKGEVVEGDCAVGTGHGMGTTDLNGGECRTNNTTHCELGAQVTGYKSFSKTNSDPPDDGGSKAKTIRSSGSCTGNTGYDLVDLGGASDPDADGAYWFASSYDGSPDADSQNMSDFDDCLPGTGDAACTKSSACDGAYNAHMPDAPAGSGQCNDYGDIYLILKTSVEKSGDGSGDVKYAAESDCAAGSGQFQLVPFWKYDNDGDGEYSAIFLPLQESGTGVMTNRAWVTAADLETGVSGETLRLVKASQDLVFDGSDQLDDASTGSTVISGQHSFSTGIYTGNPYFVVEEVAVDDILDFVVDLTWSCDTSGGQAIDEGQGWQLQASDVGCSDYIQTMTLRYFTSPNRVELQQYGNPNFTLIEPTTTTAEGQAFVFDRWGILVDATLTDWSASEATLQIDEISVGGVDVCTTGTYTLDPE